MKPQHRVAIVSLVEARTRADELWNGAVEVGAQWSSRKAHVAQLHTLAYQLLDAIAAANIRKVAIETRGAR
jgi:hypothetical protein